ncbi:MAG: 1-acyl-sn-glycerol-3-phosphate acyltransferase, partial [Cyclobacteriaceae bacterium]|nr:1-acyl-sn-glycerol-3-phosphate acyltransferase [Cyclobacteriaceae bacterium]
ALLRMIPVYRFRDGFGTLRRNEQTMTRTAALLRSGEAVLIFAEGNHDSRRRLRPLQKGFVRLAMDCLSQLPAQEKLHVVPVGIQYDSLDQFRTRVLVQFGEPVLVEAEMDQAALIEVTAQRIREMILHVEPLDSYDQQMQWLHANRRIQGDLIAQLQADRHVLAAYKGQSVPIAVSHSRPHLNPLWWWGFVNHLLPYYCLRWILRRKMKDAQFAGSLKFSVGIFLLPACYALQTSVLALLGASPTWQLLYVCHLPVVGLAAHAWSVPRSLR